MRLSSRIATPGPDPISNTRSSGRTSSRDTAQAFRLRFDERWAITRPAARPKKPVGRPNWARTAAMALCLSSIRLTPRTSVRIIQLEVHFKSRGIPAAERLNADRRVGSPHGRGHVRAPLLRTDRPAVTGRPCWPATAVHGFKRGARRADSPLPGRRLHARGDRAHARREEAGTWRLG